MIDNKSDGLNWKGKIAACVGIVFSSLIIITVFAIYFKLLIIAWKWIING